MMPILMLVVLIVATPAHGAESGDLGDDSRSRFTISLALHASLEIETASDIAINILDRTVDTQYRQPFCVRGTIDTKYTVTAFGETNSDGEFVLRNGEGEALPFAVAYIGAPSQRSPDPLKAAVPSPTYDILEYGNECGDATYFLVTFEADDLKVVGSGLYNGSITFLVSPV
ncbi:MAG: hypothetical protein U5O39_09575 [Gammaproteobacteria bacterium]|nr:hypothetical protein [Gammaproteobacteria bacterium]